MKAPEFIRNYRFCENYEFGQKCLDINIEELYARIKLYWDELKEQFRKFLKEIVDGQNDKGYPDARMILEIIPELREENYDLVSKLKNYIL